MMMKKILLTGVAYAALVVPAHAGPILDSAMEKGMTWDAESSTVVDGVEIYEGLTLTRINRTITIDNLQLSSVSGIINAEFKGMDMFAGSDEATSIGHGVVRVSDQSLEVGVSGVEEALENIIGFPTGYDACSEIDIPMAFVLNDVSVYGDPTGTFSVDTFGIGYDVLYPEGDCIVDAEITLEGIALEVQNGLSAFIEKVNSHFFWSLLNAQVPTELSELYSNSFSATNVDLEFNGEVQFSIGEIASESNLDPASLGALIEGGYFEAYLHALQQQAATGSALLDNNTLSVPGIWNAVREISSDSEFKISDLKITGDVLSGFGQAGLLDKGRDLNLNLSYDQKDADIILIMDASSTDLFDIDLMLNFGLDELDPSLEEMGVGAITMTAPISLNEMSISIDDMGLGSIVSDYMGGDVYELAGPAVSSMLGSVKGDAISDWLNTARAGGANLSIKPETPLPVMDLFAGFMGDWGRLGQNLNATTTGN